MDKIVKLQVAVKQQEHFEILEELGVKLMTTGQSVESFGVFCENYEHCRTQS